MMKIFGKKRVSSNWSTELPLTSKRVSVMLSNPSESTKLVNAVRESRKGGKGEFQSSIIINKRNCDRK